MNERTPLEVAEAVSYGCFFCKSGKEGEVVRQFEASFADARAIAPTKTRYRRSRDTLTEEHEMLLPGYVFLRHGVGSMDGQEQRDEEALYAALQGFARREGVLRLLRYSDGGWRLHGSDERFAEMLFATGGNIGISQAYFDEGDRIRIKSGFLKDYEGVIVRVNRKNKTVGIRVELQDKIVTMQLGYELVEAE